MSEIKLLPCPFCGGEAFIRQNKDAMKTYSAYCGNEDCSASPKVSAYGKEMAINLWNNRKPMQEIVERLEEASFSHSLGLITENVVLRDRAIEICKEVGGMND